MKKRNRVVVLEAPRRIGLVERPTPVPERGEVILRVTGTAICHTDLEIYTGRHPGVRYPVVMGHEAIGVVEAIGPEVARVKPGQRVVINPVIACGNCDCCLLGRGNLCRRAGLFGRELPGSLAERVLLPEGYVHPLPEHLPRSAAALIETLATVRHAQQRVGVEPGEAVVVLGQGATGLLHTQLASLAGARPVIAVSRSGWKLTLARRMRADHALDAGRGDVVEEVVRLTGGHGADVVIDAAGSPEMIGQAMQMLRPGGRLLIYAVSHRPIPEFTTFPLYFKELTLYGSRALQAGDFEPAIHLAASGAIDLEGFITASYPFHRVATAFEDYEREPGRVLRMLIVPDE